MPHHDCSNSGCFGVRTGLHGGFNLGEDFDPDLDDHPEGDDNGDHPEDEDDHPEDDDDHPEDDETS